MPYHRYAPIGTWAERDERMEVTPLKSDATLEYGVAYRAQWFDAGPESEDMRVRVWAPSKYKPGTFTTVVRTMYIDVIEPWNPKPNHGPYDFNA